MLLFVALIYLNKDGGRERRKSERGEGEMSDNKAGGEREEMQNKRRRKSIKESQGFEIMKAWIGR